MIRGVVCFLLPVLAQAEVRVVIETELGTIEVAVDDARAPVTAGNFLRYVDAGQYAGSRFHRTVRSHPDNQPQAKVKIDVIQAGPDARWAGKAFAPIPLERTSKTGLRHVDGAVSMARAAPDTATADFFICVGAQPELDFGGKRNPDGQGFAAFGRVVAGSDVVRRIHQSPARATDSPEVAQAGKQRLDPPVRILSIRRK